MFVVEVVIGVAVVLVLAVALAAAGGGLSPARPDTNDPVLPAHRLLTSADLATVRLRTSVYGYRMEDVDALMAAVHASLWSAEQQGADPAGEKGEASP